MNVFDIFFRAILVVALLVTISYNLSLDDDDDDDTTEPSVPEVPLPPGNLTLLGLFPGMIPPGNITFKTMPSTLAPLLKQKWPLKGK